jgi:hypothetical protein
MKPPERHVPASTPFQPICAKAATSRPRCRMATISSNVSASQSER